MFSCSAMARTLTLLPLLLLLFNIHSAKPQGITNGDLPACNGVFDFYFILDSSGSIGETFRERVVPFVSNVSSLYVQPDLRISFITFASTPTVHLNLTKISNREQIEAGISSLQSHPTGGFTNFVPGLKKITSQIESRGGDRASVILMLTDGILLDPSSILETAVRDAHEGLGARIFVIGIGESVSRDQLLMVADNPDQLFFGDNFEYLEEVVERIRDAVCIEITQVNPGMVCLGQTQEIILTGSGFTNNLNVGQESCRFKTSAGDQYTTEPSEPVTSTQVVCPVPMFDLPGSILLQVSLDGRTFIGSSVTLEIDDCKTISSATPTDYCHGRQPNGIVLTGSGFAALLDQSQAQCRYTTTNQIFYTIPSAPITETTIVCPPPPPEYVGSLNLQVTTNGDFYIDDIVPVQIDDCIAFGSVEPEEWCLFDEVEEVEITGDGFTDNIIRENASCTFRTQDNQLFVTRPSREVLPNLFVCPLPSVELSPGKLVLRISNGFKSIGGGVDLTIDSCIEVEYVEPAKWCVLEEVEEVRVVGAGFTGNLDMEEASCTFRINDDELLVTQPSQEVSQNLFVCPLPDVNLTVGVLYLRVHNGFTYLGEEMKMVVDDCTSRDYVFVAWIFLGLLAFLLLLGLCMLWCCIPLITGKIVGGLPPEKKEEVPPTPPPTPPPPPPAPAPPPPKPGRKWDVVDASYYGGRGAGGMKPMKVTWGGKGATELGSKLTKAKDANLIEVIEIAGVEQVDIFTPVAVPTPPPVVVSEPATKGPGCWDRFKKKLRRWYAVMSSYRPVFTNHGTLGKHILWFPGPNIQEKLTAAAEVETGLHSNGNSFDHRPPPPPYSHNSVPSPTFPPLHNTSTGPPRSQRRPPPPPAPPISESREDLLSNDI